MAAGITLPPDILKQLLERLPKVQKQRRRVKKLRGTEENFAKMRQREIKGEDTKTHIGGLGYETASHYIPDYTGMAEKAIGAVGEYMTGRKADTEEEALEADRNRAVLEGTEMLGKKDGVNEQTKRAYLQMLMGGEDDTGLKDIVGKPPHVSSKSVLADKTIILHMSDGSDINTGRKALHDGQNFRDGETGEILNVSGGVGSMVTEGPADAGTAPPPAVPPATETPSVPPPETPPAEPAPDPNAVQAEMAAGPLQMGAQTAPAEEAPPVTSDDLPPDLTTEDIVQVGPWSVDMKGMPPDAKEDVRSTLQNMTNAKVPQAAMEETVKAFLIKADAMRNGQSEGMPIAGNIQTSEGEIPDPVAAQGAVASQMGQEALQMPAAPAPAPAPAPRTPIRTTPDAQIAGSVARAQTEAKIRAEAGLAPMAAGTSATIAGATETATKEAAAKVERVENAKNSLSRLRIFLPSAKASIRKLYNPETKQIHPGLLKVVQGGIGSFIPKKGADNLGVNAARALFAKTYPDGADVLALIDQIGSNTFLQGFQSIAGQGAGSIDRAEGEKIQGAVGRIATTQSVKQFVEGLQEIEDTFNRAEQTLNLEITGGTPMAPGQRMSDEEYNALRQKYRKP